MAKLNCTISQEFKKYLPDHLKRAEKVRSLLIKHGNKARANRYFLTILKILAKKTKKNPVKVLDLSVFHLTPTFVLRRIMRAGKMFQLPVPITNNHANFLAINWLRKAVYAVSIKSKTAIPVLFIKELMASLRHKGGAYASFKDYLAIALDNRPFLHYIRKKRKIISKSRRGSRMNEKLWKRELRRRSFVYHQNKNRFLNGQKAIKQIISLKNKRFKFKNKKKYAYNKN